MMDKTLLEEIKNRVAAATPGPWQSWVEGRDHESASNVITTAGDDIELIGGSIADQDFIASARQDIPILLAEIERLESLLSAASLSIDTSSESWNVSGTG